MSKKQTQKAQKEPMSTFAKVFNKLTRFKPEDLYIEIL